MTTRENSRSSWVKLLALSSNYERRARLLPAVASLAPLLPLTLALGTSIVGWGTTLLATSGVGVIFAVAIAHLASAFGNRLQDKLWPQWPHDVSRLGLSGPLSARPSWSTPRWREKP